ncbi:NAD(P)/FAD-dependent oxidoreductase [Spirulina sp. 06S082]|uniref:NAD(P)/FAD-dependent oxidoreductase n=1 Tax=Spirulina sp. 06S082 TaxID=3110248 RepID=UPI002B1FB281|nr:tryptophan 7-halogenase [Spirulina sp. 06S082]MEA5469869.1 tryptophan 7-halogenase [Spirulina sp. 06S082]
MNDKTYDVVICGAGLAGLTLARQLKQTMPDLSVLTIDKLNRPLPEIAFKVGESTVEVGACYLANIIHLKDYLEENHYPKLGIRYFFGDGCDAFQKRPELGLSRFHAPESYQVDRGKLENDLRKFNEEDGVHLLENCSVKEINLAENNGDLHQITYSKIDTKETGTVKAKWVIDSMGRRRFLQKKLGLAQPNNDRYNASWFWVDGRLDVTDFVSQNEQEWHDRVPEKNRYFSTNHLCGDGYWIWIIPLSTGATSIGIVAHEDYHSFESYHTYEKASQWLAKHEPILASCLTKKTPKKFMKMPKYSYTSDKIFSFDRWACVGDAATFPDPFYSPATDFIGFANSSIVNMIELDRQGQLTEKTVNSANRFFLIYQKSITKSIQTMYHCLGNGLVGTMKVIWDTLAAWSFSAPLMFSDIYLDSQKRNKVYSKSGQFFLLTNRVQHFFRDWSEKSSGNISFGFVDYLELPFVKELRERNLQLNRSEEELIQDHLANIEIFEELAQAIFIIAIADIMPEQLNKVLSAGWLNAWAISLDANEWEKGGLFKPKSSPRDLQRILNPLQNNFGIKILELERQFLDTQKEKEILCR